MGIKTTTTTVTQVFDSLDGKLLPASTKPLMVAIDSDIYALYFSEANREKFNTSIRRYLKNETPYTEDAESHSKALKGSTQASTHESPVKPAEGHTGRPTIRQWARDNGFNVNDKGRIAKDVLLAYAKAF